MDNLLQKKYSNPKQYLLLVTGLVVILLIWAYAVSGEFVRFSSSNEVNRHRLIELSKKVQIGSNYEDVLKAYWTINEGTELQLKPYSSSCWEISMPAEITATDWRMFLSFNDEKVSGFAIRTSDGPKPKDGPADLGDSIACGVK